MSGKHVKPLLLFLAVAGVLGIVFWGKDLGPEAEEDEEDEESVEYRVPPARPDPDSVEVTRTLIVGGGADPSSNQVSLAQDLRLARDTMAELGHDTTVLFGSGDASLVQVADEEQDASLRERLGELFDPRDRHVRYEPVDLSIAAPADAEMLLSLIEKAGAEGDPLFVFIAGHGERGDLPQDAVVRLWGDIPLTVHDLAETLGPTPAHVVMGSCFSGGFASLAYLDGDPDHSEELAPDRCGFFATTWDREASGCDPNPERGQQLGYAIQFYHALRGQDRGGESVDVDFDNDDTITLLEAHTQARIAGRSFDVPTTTSEFYLRRVAEKNPELEVSPEPEEAAVIAAVGSELSLDSAEAAYARLDSLQAALAHQEDLVAEAQARADHAFYSLRIRLLERWPILDDPWHREFDGLLSSQTTEIEEALNDSVEGREYEAALAAMQQTATAFDEIQMELARVMVLARAHETAALTSSLQAVGGPGWEGYERLRACERSIIQSP